MAWTVDGQFKNLRPGLEIPDGPLVVLTGQNNAGKSAILQWLNIRSPIAGNADYVSPRRFELSNEVAIALNSDAEIASLFSQRKQWNETLAELAAPDPIRELVHASNADRQRVIEWHNRYFGELQIEKLHPDNEYSPPKITIDGRLATQQGSGSRAVLALLVPLLGPRANVILIDEPEIGIEPQVQRRLAELIRAVAAGEGGAQPKQVYLATHSHLFLDRTEIANNYVVSKSSDGWAQLQQVASVEGLQNLVFTLLGNTPGDLFFPDNILVVEGPSDEIFWRRLLELGDGRGIAVHYSDGEGQIAAALPAIEQMLKTLVYMPGWYRERMCLAVDSDVADARVGEWRTYLGDDGTRVRKLTRPGIEYFYPTDRMQAVTTVDPPGQEPAIDAFLAAFRSGAREAKLGAFSGSKRQLAREIADLMTADDLAALDPQVTAVLDVVRARSLRTS